MPQFLNFRLTSKNLKDLEKIKTNLVKSLPILAQCVATELQWQFDYTYIDNYIRIWQASGAFVGSIDGIYTHRLEGADPQYPVSPIPPYHENYPTLIKPYPGKLMQYDPIMSDGDTAIAENWILNDVPRYQEPNSPNYPELWEEGGTETYIERYKVGRRSKADELAGIDRRAYKEKTVTKQIPDIHYFEKSVEIFNKLVPRLAEDVIGEWLADAIEEEHDIGSRAERGLGTGTMRERIANEAKAAAKKAERSKPVPTV